MSKLAFAKHNNRNLSNFSFVYRSILKISILIYLLFYDTPLSAQEINYDLFVSSRNTHSVKLFDGKTGDSKGDFIPSGSANLNTTQEVAFGLDGNLYVSGRGNSVIKKYNGSTGEFIENFTSGYSLDNPTKMSFGPDGMLYVSQWGTAKSKITRFNSTTGEFVDEFTSINLNQGCGHAWDAFGNLYVASFGSADVRKFDKEGNFIEVFTEAGHLQGAVNLWFTPDSQLMVVDWKLGSVLKFDGKTGAYLSVFISGMQNTEGVTIGPDGMFYLCDWSRNTINRYDGTGTFIDVFASGNGLLAPNGLVFGPAIAITSVDKIEGKTPKNFKLNQNFPNPFNPSTIINFDINEPSHVNLSIFSISGQIVATLIDDDLAAGNYNSAWDANNSSSGIYFYRLQTENHTLIKKMVLLR